MSDQIFVNDIRQKIRNRITPQWTLTEHWLDDGPTVLELHDGRGDLRVVGSGDDYDEALADLWADLQNEVQDDE